MEPEEEDLASDWPENCVALGRTAERKEQIQIQSQLEVLRDFMQIFFWDWRTKKQIACLEESHMDDVTQVQFVPNHQNKLLSASVDGLMCIFDARGRINNDDHLESRPRIEGQWKHGTMQNEKEVCGQIICTLGHLQPLWLTTGVFCRLEVSSGGTLGRMWLLGWTPWFVILLFGIAANILDAVGMYWRCLALNSPVQQMAANDPFVRVYFESHDPELHTLGGLFYLHTASNQSHLAGVSTSLEPENLTYEASPDFVAKYSKFYPMGHVLVWDNKESFSTWLDSLIYCSFLLSSDQGVTRPWFVKEIPAPNAYQLMGVPIGFERFVNEEYETFWILLKSGSRVWPVRIVNNNFRDNWSSFLKDHGVEPNFKIVFGCYKKWIFDVCVEHQLCKGYASLEY